MTVRVVLWDADGVLQRLPARDQFFPTLDPQAGAALAAAVFGPLPELLTGRLDMSEHFDRVLAGQGLLDQRTALLALWDDPEPVDEARAVLSAVRRAGVRCVLASNQDTLRADAMRGPYGALLDAAYFSCDLGVAKPEAAYFAHIADREGVAPGDLLLIDDSEANVEGARAAGLAAQHWHFDDGIGALNDALRHHLPMSAWQAPQAARSSRRREAHPGPRSR